jgi:hypothetical protein
MSEEYQSNDAEPKTDGDSKLNHKLSAVGWSLFFIWIGIALLMKIDAGIGLLGVGIITLGMQGVRKYFSLKLEGFWVVVGLLFVIGGLWDVFEAKISLVPILLILGGLALLLRTIMSKHREKE